MPRRPKPPAEWMRDASDDQAVAEGCYFDIDAANYVCSFLETFCYLSEGRQWAGKPMRLIPWQRDLVSRQYGWKRDDGLRRFQSVYTEVGKKNGKSPMVSGKATYHLTADGEEGPKIFLNACDKAQARIVFDHAKAMVEQSPPLAKRIEVIDSEDRLYCKANRGVLTANSSTVDAKDGLNASYVVFDEIHRFPDRKTYNVFQGAGASREQPMQDVITTAGPDDTGVWHDLRVYSERTARGETQDITHLGVVYRADPKDDFDDPAVWAKANPSFGYTITPDQFKREMLRSRQNPIDWNDFLRKRFNVIASGSEKYFDMSKWDACKSPTPLDASSLRGLPTFMGLDLAATADLTALVALAGSHDVGFKLLSRFWCPEARLLALEHSTRMPYRAWAEAGYLTATPGERTDYDFVRREINEIAAQTQVRLINVDAAMAQQLCTQLAEQDGLPVKFIRQGFISLNDPTKQFEKLIAEGKIAHDDNPVMRWCLSNAVADTDAVGNIKLNKKKSREKIDGAYAAINAVAGTLSEAEDSGPSVYQTRGLLTL